jgi:chromosome partitioning protein
VQRLVGDDLADLVVVPVRPSPADLWAVGGTVELVRRAGKPFAALSEHGRVARSNTAPELWPRGPTAGEIDALWTELIRTLPNQNRVNLASSP